MRAYANIPEGQIHYQIAGNGKPVLLLHQTPLSSDEYAKVIPILARSCRVIAMDTMGYGKSDPHPKANPSIADFTQSVVNFIKALGIKKTSIVGHHTGATIAVEVAVTHPELVDKLMLSGCPISPLEIRKARLSDPKFRPIPVKADGSHLIEIWNYYRDRWKIEVSLEAQHLSVVTYCMAGNRVEDGHHAVYSHEIELRLPLIKNPTLLMSSTNDVQHRYLESVKKLIPGAQTAIIEGGGIHVAIDMPNEFAQAVLNFLK